jgi:hypothetical protein
MALVELVIPPGGRQFVNESLPVAVSVFVLRRQGFKGTQNPLNETKLLTAILVKFVTRPVTELVTVTLNSVLLPVLVTVPV